MYLICLDTEGFQVPPQIVIERVSVESVLYAQRRIAGEHPTCAQNRHFLLYGSSGESHAQTHTIRP